MTRSWIDEVKGRLGFGFARIPMDGDDVDYEATNVLVDEFLRQGFNYFDVACFYANNHDEDAIRKCLVERHPRDSFMLCDKLSMFYFDSEEQILPIFENQLKACGVDYFDMYLMHGQSAEFYAKYKRCHAYEIALELKRQGKIRHFGISFHDKAPVLDRILTDYPQIEVVQIQFNYLDYEDINVQSKLCYEVCVEHGVPCIVMEPLRGGSLVQLTGEAQEALDSLKACAASGVPTDNVSFALRFAANFPNNVVVLSGMNAVEQVRSNARTMRDPVPMSQHELEVLGTMHDIFQKQGKVQCTGCRYCMVKCPKHILIPEMIEAVNSKRVFNNENGEWYYIVYTMKGGKPLDCIGCRACERSCPQHLPIVKLMREATRYFGKFD